MSAWDEARLGGKVGSRHALGLWNPLHSLASLAWMPPASERRKIYGKQRYVYIFNFNYPANTSGASFTINARLSTTQDFWWTDSMYAAPFIIGSSYIELYDTKNGIRYTNMPELDVNFSGTPGNVQINMPAQILQHLAIPEFKRRIVKIPAGAQLLARISAQLGTTFGATPQQAQLAVGGFV